MPTDFRLKLIHATRYGALRGFGKSFRINNHSHVKKEAQKYFQYIKNKRKENRSRKLFKKMTTKKRKNSSKKNINNPFSHHQIIDVGTPSTTNTLGGGVQQHHRKKALSSSYANYNSQNLKKRLSLSTASPKIFYNSTGFEANKRDNGYRAEKGRG